MTDLDDLDIYKMSEEEVSRMMGNAEYFCRVTFGNTRDREIFLKVCRNLDVKTFMIYGEQVMDIYYTEKQNKALFATVRMADIKTIKLVKWGKRQEYIDMVEKAARAWGKDYFKGQSDEKG